MLRSLLKNVTVGRRINRSAANATSMENALNQPNRRSDGKSEKTVTCHLIEKVSFPVDPMKTDAVGWLAGELKPPR